MSEGRGGCHLRLVPPIEMQAALSEPDVPDQMVVGMSDRDLARRLARVELVSIDTAMWRHVSPREQSRPESGDGAINAGGRFNPRRSFPAVYGSLRRADAGAEFRMLARRHPIGIDNLLPRHLYRFQGQIQYNSRPAPTGCSEDSGPTASRHGSYPPHSLTADRRIGAGVRNRSHRRAQRSWKRRHDGDLPRADSYAGMGIPAYGTLGQDEGRAGNRRPGISRARNDGVTM